MTVSFGGNRHANGAKAIPVEYNGESGTMNMKKNNAVIFLYIPPSVGTIFRHRIVNWGGMIKENKMRERFSIKFFLPKNYDNDSFLGYFYNDEILFFDGEEFPINKAHYLVINFIKNLDFNCLDIAFILTGEKNPFKHHFPDATYFHFEMGAFSRAPLPTILRYDCGGFFNDSDMTNLNIFINNDSISKKILAIADLSEKLYTITAPIIDDESRIFIENSKIDGRKVFLFPAPPSIDSVTDIIAGEHFSRDEILRKICKILPRQSALLITHHPSETDNNFTMEGQSIFNVRLKYAPGVSGGAITNSILPHVNGVISISSMVGLHAKLLKKCLFAHSNGFLSKISDKTFNFHSEKMNKNLTINYSNKSRLSIAYILAFLHLPPEIWENGYGMEYFNHNISKKGISDLANQVWSEKHVESVLMFYEKCLT